MAISSLLYFVLITLSSSQNGMLNSPQGYLDEQPIIMYVITNLLKWIFRLGQQGQWSARWVTRWTFMEIKSRPKILMELLTNLRKNIRDRSTIFLLRHRSGCNKIWREIDRWVKHSCNSEYFLNIINPAYSNINRSSVALNLLNSFKDRGLRENWAVTEDLVLIKAFNTFFLCSMS